MNYEEKYRKLIDTLQLLIYNGKKQGHIILRIEDIENAIPELSESKDESMMKVLLRGFKNYSIVCEKFGGVDVNDIIAWLEKQGDKKSVDNVEPKFKVGDKV